MSLKEKEIKIAVIVTDRHVQITKWIKDNLATTDHRYDVWHVAKCESEKRSCWKAEGMQRITTVDTIHQEPPLVLFPNLSRR